MRARTGDVVSKKIVKGGWWHGIVICHGYIPETDTWVCLCRVVDSRNLFIAYEDEIIKVEPAPRPEPKETIILVPSRF